SGGLAARDLRRTAAMLETDEATAGFVVELAAAADLVRTDEQDEPSFAATPTAITWLAMDLSDRWAALASAWWTTERTPWLVGTRDQRGALRPALHPELRRP